MKFAMSDSRSFTDYQPNCSLQNKLQSDANIKNTHAYRYYLQKNTENLMKQFATFNGNNCVLCPVCKQSLTYSGKPL